MVQAFFRMTDLWYVSIFSNNITQKAECLNHLKSCLPTTDTLFPLMVSAMICLFSLTVSFSARSKPVWQNCLIPIFSIPPESFGEGDLTQSPFPVLKRKF